MTIRDGLKQATEILRQTSDAPELDAQRLLLKALRLEETSALFARGEAELTPDQETVWWGCVKRRLSGEPLAYILGVREFYGRLFEVTQDVLIPRPATEGLVDTAMNEIAGLGQRLNRPLVIADIGTGSGCVAITLLKEMKKFEIKKFFATDISSQALQLARRNAVRHSEEDRIEFLEGDLLEPLRGRTIDLIVSNPPYVPTAELEERLNATDPESRGLKFEPRIALDGGADGADFSRRIAAGGIPAVMEITGGKTVKFQITNNR